MPLLLAFAAAGPALRRPVGHGIRAGTEAIFVFDVSRSMDASSSPNGASRLAVAKAAAVELRASIPDVPAGISSLTTVLLPELFPTPDEQSFIQTLTGSIGVLKPAPPAFQPIATSFDPLGALGSQGFFKPTTRDRVVILLTDGESGPFSAQGVASGLSSTTGPGPSFGAPTHSRPTHVELIVVRLGTAADRIYRANGGIDPDYRPDLNAAGLVAALTQATGGRAFTAGQLAGAQVALRADIGRSSNSSRLVTSTTLTRLAPLVAIAALLPLGLLAWRRNITDL